MTKEEKDLKRGQLQTLFLQKGVRATKIAKDLHINRATVYTACNPSIERYIKADTLIQIENYLTNINL